MSERVRVVALGNQDRGDDGAALLVANRLHREAKVILAGRPGPGLLDLLPMEEVCVLLDVTCSGAPAGTFHRIKLKDLQPALLPDLRVSSHGFGPGEALALARTLGRPLPEGYFLGVEGERFGPEQSLSPDVEKRLPAFEEMARQVIRELRGE